MNNRRRTTLLLLAAACLLLAAAALAGASLPETAFAADFSRKNLPPCPAFPFGTDWAVPVHPGGSADRLRLRRPGPDPGDGLRPAGRLG